MRRSRPAARTVVQFLGSACTAHPLRSFRSLVMAGGMVGDRLGPFACIDARDRLPSVAATREHVPPVLPAGELPISPKRSDNRAAVEALASRFGTGGRR